MTVPLIPHTPDHPGNHVLVSLADLLPLHLVADEPRQDRRNALAQFQYDIPNEAVTHDDIRRVLHNITSFDVAQESNRPALLKQRIGILAEFIPLARLLTDIEKRNRWIRALQEPLGIH
jgi:hypothetical protein